MNLVKVAAGTLNQTPLDWEGNYERIVASIKKAKEQKVSILCLPELCISGYGCEDAFFSPNTFKKSLLYLKKVVPYTSDIVVSVGLPLMIQNKAFNTACLIADGQIQGFVAKQFLAGNGIHYEPRWFTAWNRDGFTTIEIDGQKYKVGDLFFNVGGIKIGFEICEDAWVAQRPGSKMYEDGLDILLNPSASHFAFGKINIRKRFVLEGSRAFGVTYIYANLLGNEAGRAIYDGGGLIASNGEMIAEGRRFSFLDNDITTAIIDVDVTRMAQIQMQTTFVADQDPFDSVDFDFSYPAVFPEKNKVREESWEQSIHIKEEEFTRAMILGLFDYLRKSYSKGYVISMSGGADSSAIACLCYLMVQHIIDQYGYELLSQKLSYIEDINSHTPESILSKLITGAYQATENSSATTRNAAEELAKALQIKFYNFEIDHIIKAYRSVVEKSIGRQLTWDKDDITLQNIQARGRAPSIWMLANIENALLLSTSNRSEAAVGYATMDGDTSGGLSPIAGIDKNFLRNWLNWLQKVGMGAKIKIPALKHINEQKPTAELRPSSYQQNDENDLMPYDVLDYIEKAAIGQKNTPIDCFYLVQVAFPEYSKKEIKQWVKKFFLLWCRNQWKRERYAPSFHVDDKNLDPKTWCRFPILSGGFQVELNELDQI